MNSAFRIALSGGLMGLAFFAISPVVHAEDFSVASTITAVTVFDDRARVTRQAEVDLPEGRHRLLVPNLPEGLDRDALEVRFTTESGNVTLGAVDVRTVHEADLVNIEEEELVVTLEQLAFATREQEDAIEAEQMVIGIIENIGKAIAERTADSIAADLPRPERWSETWIGLKEGAATSMSRIRLAEREISHLQKQVEQTERRLEQIRTGARATVSLDVEVIAETASLGSLQVSYLVSGASWQPIYEARLDTSADRLDLIQLAAVTQGTGEDWADVSLTLSTARPGAAAPLPELPSWFIDVREPELPAPVAQRSSEAMLDQAKLATAAPSIVAEVETSTFQVEYQVPGPVSVPATREPYRVTLSQHSLDSDLSVRAIPKFGLEPQIYVRATFDGDAPLLPGPLVLYRDGTFAGNRYQEALPPGDVLDMAFGPDDLVTVKQIYVTGQRDRQGLIRNRQRHERRYRIEVTNHHDIVMPITVLEQLPVPQDARITVELLENATPPTETDFDGRTGVLAWSYDFAPGESRTIDFAYIVSHPAEIQVTGF